MQGKKRKENKKQTGSGLWYVFTLFGSFKGMPDFSWSEILHFSEVMLSASIYLYLYFDGTFQDKETLILTILNEDHNLINQGV